jgi:hypothetical protein
MEMKKLHLGTMSYGVDSMDEVALQLATALGEEKSIRTFRFCAPPFLPAHVKATLEPSAHLRLVQPLRTSRPVSLLPLRGDGGI